MENQGQSLCSFIGNGILNRASMSEARQVEIVSCGNQPIDSFCQATRVQYQPIRGSVGDAGELGDSENLGSELLGIVGFGIDP